MTFFKSIEFELVVIDLKIITKSTFKLNKHNNNSNFWDQ